MTVNVDKLNLNAHGILLNQDYNNSPSQARENNTPPILPVIQPRRSQEHVRTPYPHHSSQENLDSRGRGQADGRAEGFRQVGPEVRGINALGAGPRSNPGQNFSQDGFNQMPEDVRRQQEDVRNQVQRDRLREPVHNQLDRVHQELQNQQFQVQGYQVNYPEAQGMIRDQGFQQMDQPRSNQQMMMRGQFPDPPRQDRLYSLQNQIEEVDQHLQNNQRRRAVSFSNQYEQMTNAQGQNQNQMPRNNGQ